VYVANAGAGIIHRIEGSNAPRFNADNVVNAASFAPGVVAGSLGTVFAAGVLDAPGVMKAENIPLPASLNGVSMTMGGVTAPLLSISNVSGQEQVNFQVPFELAGQTNVPVVITRAGEASASVNVALAEVKPAVYTSDGRRAIAVHNADFSLVTDSRPLERGEYGFVYVAGVGRVSNAPATGAAAPSSTLARALGDVQVTMAGSPCEVQFAGLAPGLVGVFQVNFRVAQSARAGLADLVVNVGGVASPAVQVPVR
jgi:uncharacterized protein (TIGR03437 family)